MLIFSIINIFLIALSAYSEEVTVSTIKSQEIDVFDTDLKNSIGNNLNVTISANTTVQTQKVNQGSQSQQVERTVDPESKNISKSSNENNRVLLTDFKPSQQLESYYEFNKFPVKPALPEAKHFQFTQDQNFWEFSSTTEQPWVNRVKFPLDSPVSPPNNQYLPVKDTKSEGLGFGFSKPADHMKPPVYGTANKWEKFGFDKKVPIPYHHQSQFNLMEQPPIHLPKTYEHSEIGGHGGGFDPWKKIITLLTAFIPIGLLISALTPTVITVTPMNETNLRSRAENSRQEIATRLLSSLNQFQKLNDNGCEDRLFCELLLSASNSANAEQHVQNLLDNFTQQENNAKNKIENLKKIFDAGNLCINTSLDIISKKEVTCSVFVRNIKFESK